MKLQDLIEHIADACKSIDAQEPPFKEFQAGVGPYGEPQLVRLLAERLNRLPNYRGLAKSKRTPDRLITGSWALEFKIARPYGDNGIQAENWSVNLLHPYPGNISVFGDCLKLARWNGPERRAAIVIGFEHQPPEISLEPLLYAFEAVAERLLPFAISPRVEVCRDGLRHPVHQVVRVAGWEIPSTMAIQ